MIAILIQLLVIVLVVWLLIYILDMLKLPAPANVIVRVIAALCLLAYVLRLFGVVTVGPTLGL